MFGFNPLSTLPISTLGGVVPAATSAGGAGDGSGRKLTQHERRRRRRHLERQAAWRAHYESLLSDRDATPEVRAVATSVAQLGMAPTRAFSIYVAPVAPPPVLRQLGDRREPDDVERAARTAEYVAARLASIVHAARLAREAAEDEDDVAALLALA